MAYVTTAVFLAVSGGTFLVATLRSVGAAAPLTALLFAAVVLWLTVLVTVITMRLFAEEKRSGTLEVLMTAPVTETEVVLGKFAGALVFLLIAAAPAASTIFLLDRLSPGIASVDMGAFAGGCTILVLVSSFCLSIGLLVSLMTRNQIVAAIVALCIIWVVLLSGWLLSILPFAPEAATEYLSTLRHIDEFARGSVETRPIIFYVSGTVLMLFTSVRVLESGRWK